MAYDLSVYRFHEVPLIQGIEQKCECVPPISTSSIDGIEQCHGYPQTPADLNVVEAEEADDSSFPISSSFNNKDNLEGVGHPSPETEQGAKRLRLSAAGHAENLRVKEGIQRRKISQMAQTESDVTVLHPAFESGDSDFTHAENKPSKCVYASFHLWPGHPTVLLSQKKRFCKQTSFALKTPTIQPAQAPAIRSTSTSILESQACLDHTWRCIPCDQSVYPGQTVWCRQRYIQALTHGR
jgi:hypothetical protein